MSNQARPEALLSKTNGGALVGGSRNGEVQWL